ncbi:TPA: hypothetical protein ACTW3A_001586 [Klebsiella quasipneumoniae subsp. quasipneumoniae]|nr:hypothetical protein [Klebsiella quasipneumoniae subsp. quasipneumoniae]HBU5901267.1 hypothetical protein [Klebsiella quasipneumoniae subsp. quasipneumoniae]HBZ0086981.1 hypothetical protein [Klebsiella pneumoniae]HCB0902388.1 hypothetical protein [Klebsiella pneumoniae]HCB0934408.1 hypothetical protein [Klebsiella pneumoniae]
MAEQTKSLSAKSSAVTTGGVGALLSVVVGALIPDPNDPWRSVAYAGVPIAAAAITYFMSWVISRHGLESPEDAMKRSKCLRDLKTIDKQLKFNEYSEDFRAQLIKDRERTVSILVNIGKDSVPRSVNTPEESG